MLGKILASSLTLSIGGSGGVFAPSLFIGAMAGMAFGTVAHHLFGPAVGPPALYAVVAMGGVFAAAAQAPLTAIASVVEMTGNFGLTLPDHARLRDRRRASPSTSPTAASTPPSCCAAASTSSDQERPTCCRRLTVADVMQPIPHLDGDPHGSSRCTDAAGGSATRRRRAMGDASPAR